ncbi:MAG: hypothetical protein R2879_03745 [Saprospiraceae bacterium]
MLRTYFDLEENEALFSLVDAFRQLIKRNKIISDASKNGYANLFRLTRKAAKIRYDIGYKSKEKLQEELEKLKLEIKDAGMESSTANGSKVNWKKLPKKSMSSYWLLAFGHWLLAVCKGLSAGTIFQNCTQGTAGL